jgi:hypothetical protein
MKHFLIAMLFICASIFSFAQNTFDFGKFEGATGTMTFPGTINGTVGPIVVYANTPVTIRFAVELHYETTDGLWRSALLNCSITAIFNVGFAWLLEQSGLEEEFPSHLSEPYASCSFTGWGEGGYFEKTLGEDVNFTFSSNLVAIIATETRDNGNGLQIFIPKLHLLKQ